MGAVGCYLASLAFEDSDDGLTIPQRLGLTIVGVVVAVVVLALIE